MYMQPNIRQYDLSALYQVNGERGKYTNKSILMNFSISKRTFKSGKFGNSISENKVKFLNEDLNLNKH